MLSGFVPILVTCLLGGLAFAFLAYQTARYAATALSAKSDPTKIEINKYISISTGNAVVALFMLSVVVMAGVPAYWLYLNGVRVDAPISFEAAHIDPEAPSYTIASRDFGQSAVLKVPLFRSSQTQHFTITSTPDYDAIDLDAYYNWTDNAFMISVNHQPEVPVPVQASMARLTNTIRLTKAKITGQAVANDVTVSAVHGRTTSDVLVPDPPAVAKR